jgi:hypothetical protein
MAALLSYVLTVPTASIRESIVAALFQAATAKITGAPIRVIQRSQEERADRTALAGGSRWVAGDVRGAH